MGRIADAMKKAKGERSERNRVGVAKALSRAGDLPTASGLTGLVSEIAPDRTRPSPSTPAIGAPVSDIKSEIETPQYRRTTAADMSSGEIAPQPAWDVHPTVVALRQKSSPITEQYRAARTWLLRRYTPNKMNCVAVTSSVPREGKSVTTANLAVAMAEVRHMDVLAVDCDFRQGSLAKLFKVPNSPGLSDVLAGRATLESAIQKTPLSNLYLLPGGNCHDINSTELLNSTSAIRIFEKIRERFHYTLVDTPPVHCLSDVGVIGALCTGIVVVVRMNKTPSHLVRQSVRWLQANNLNLLGCIAADCSAKGARYEYDAKDAH